jgi:hypothetical protein
MSTIYDSKAWNNLFATITSDGIIYTELFSDGHNAQDQKENNYDNQY